MPLIMLLNLDDFTPVLLTVYGTLQNLKCLHFLKVVEKKVTEYRESKQSWKGGKCKQ